MIFFIRSIFAQTLLNAYMIYRIRKNGTMPLWMKKVLYVIYAVEVLFYFLGFFYGEAISVDLYAGIQKLNGVWVIGHIYICLLFVLYEVVYFFERKFKLFKNSKEDVVQWTKFYCILLVLLFIGFRLYLGYENDRHPNVKNFSFEFNKSDKNSSQKPKATYKLLVASDLHLGYIVDKEKLKKYVEFINKQDPDIVVIDGDLVDYSLRPLIAQKMDEELRKIKAPKGLFFIPGNHEYKFNPEVKLDWISKVGFTVLKDSVATIDNLFCLIGRDDRSNKKRLYIQDLIAKADLTKPCVFLAHQPSDIHDALHYKIPLTVCGHTHGGQIFPLNLAGPLIFSNSYGMQEKDNCYSYTTSGLGLSGFPLRIVTNSEVVVFNIEIY